MMLKKTTARLERSACRKYQDRRRNEEGWARLPDCWQSTTTAVAMNVLAQPQITVTALPGKHHTLGHATPVLLRTTRRQEWPIVESLVTRSLCMQCIHTITPSNLCLPSTNKGRPVLRAILTSTEFLLTGTRTRAHASEMVFLVQNNSQSCFQMFQISDLGRR